MMCAFALGPLALVVAVSEASVIFGRCTLLEMESGSMEYNTEHDWAVRGQWQRVFCANPGCDKMQDECETR